MAGGRRLESYQLILLRRPEDAPAFDDATLDRLQAEHLAFYDVPSMDAARALAGTDPMVVAGRLVVEAMTYLTAPGTLTGPSIPIVLED